MSSSGIAFSIMAFGIFLNLAAGIMFAVVPYFDNPVDPEARGLTFNESYGGKSIQELQGAINPQGLLTDKTDSTARLLDSIGLGFLARLASFIDNLLFGFINMLENMFGHFLIGEGNDHILKDRVFLGLKGVMLTIYVLSIISLWTNREVQKD